MSKIIRQTILLFILLGGLFAGLFFLLPLPGNIPVLMYHFIDTPERAAVEKNVVSRQSFKKQMAFLKRFGFHVITMDEYYSTRMGTRSPRSREVVITFDDGNYTFVDQAFPILKEYNYPSTMFVVSENIKKHLYGSMTEETLKELVQTDLVTLGSHSRTHPVLTEINSQQLEQELLGSKNELETMFKKPFKYFAYPSGAINEHVKEMSRRAGYTLAFTTSPKKLGGVKQDLHSITRLKVSRTSDNPVAFWFKLSGLYDWFKNLG